MRNFPGALRHSASLSAPSPRTLSAAGVSRPHLLPLALLLSSLGAAPAMAGPLDPVHLYAGVSWFHDDNLFRLSDNQPAYDGKRGDSARQAVVGVFIDEAYARQKFFVQAKRSKVAFNHFKQLDYTGADYQARWNWVLGNRLSGTAGASYATTLAPYTDFRSNERNLREQRRAYFDGAWRFHPSWRVTTATNRDRYEYELLVQRVNDREETSSEVGVDYLPKSGSVAGLVARRVKGNYLNQRAFSSFTLDDSFTQDELKARVDWKVTPISTIALLAGRVERKYEGVNARTVNGFNGRLTVYTQPRAKLRLTGAVFREFSPVESNIVSYALSNGVSLGATWEATSKLRVQGSASSQRREYEAARADIDASSLKDKSKQASLNAVWSPRNGIQFNAGLSHSKRNGATVFGSGNYSASTVSLGANAQF